MKNLIIIAWQLMTYFPVKIILRVIFNIEVKTEYNLNKKSTYILAINHLKMTDAFLIASFIPFRDFIKLVPLRFITTKKYMNQFYLWPFLSLFGCISTKKIKGKSAIHKAEKLLEKKETILIFPTGKIIKKENQENKPHVGFIYLEREVKNSKIIPIKISYSKNKTKIEFKKEIKHPEFPKDLQSLANETYKKIIE